MAPERVIFVMTLFMVFPRKSSNAGFTVSEDNNAFMHIHRTDENIFAILQCIADFLSLLLLVQGVEPNPGPLAFGTSIDDIDLRKKRRPPGLIPINKCEITSIDEEEEPKPIPRVYSALSAPRYPPAGGNDGKKDENSDSDWDDDTTSSSKHKVNDDFIKQFSSDPLPRTGPPLDKDFCQCSTTDSDSDGVKIDTPYYGFNKDIIEPLKYKEEQANQIRSESLETKVCLQDATGIKSNSRNEWVTFVSQAHNKNGQAKTDLQLISMADTSDNTVCSQNNTCTNDGSDWDSDIGSSDSLAHDNGNQMKHTDTNGIQLSNSALKQNHLENKVCSKDDSGINGATDREFYTYKSVRPFYKSDEQANRASKTDLQLISMPDPIDTKPCTQADKDINDESDWDTDDDTSVSISHNKVDQVEHTSQHDRQNNKGLRQEHLENKINPLNDKGIIVKSDENFASEKAIDILLSVEDDVKLTSKADLQLISMPGSSDTKVCSNTDFKGGSDWDSNTDIQIKLVYTKDDQRTHTSKTNLQLISVPDSSDTRESSDDESDWDSDTDALDQYGREEFIGNNQSKITIRAKVMNNLKKTSADKKDGNKLSCKPVSVNIDKSQFKKDDSDCYNDRSDWDDDSCASLPARNIKQINVDSGNTKFLPNNNSTCNTASKVDTAKRNEVTRKIKENSSVPNRVKTNDSSVNKCTQPKSPIDTDAEASDWDDVNSIMNTSTKNSKEGICQKSASKSFGNNKQDTIVNNGKTKDIEAALKGHTKVHSIMSSVTTSNVRSERPPKTCLDTDDEDSDWDNDSDILGVKQLVVNAVKDEQTSEPNRIVDIMNIGCKSNETTKDVASENTYSKDNLVLSKRTTDNVNKSPVKTTVFSKTCLDNDDDLSEWDDESVNSIENIQLDDPKPITKDIGSNGTANNVCIEKKKHVGVKVAFSEENGIQPYTLNDDDKKESVKIIALPQICLDTDEDSSDWDDELDVSVVKQSLRNEVNDVQTSKPKTFFSIENHGRLSNETMLDSKVENTRPEDLLLSNSTADNINKRSINEYVLPKTCIDTDGEPSDWDDESVMSSKNVPSEHNDESIGHKCSSKHVAGFCAMTTVVQSNEIQPEHRIEKTMVSNVTAGNGRSVPTRAFPKTCIDTDDEASDWDDDSVNHCADIPPHHDKRNSDKKSAPTETSCTDYGICSNKQKHTEETLKLHPNANLIKSNKSSDRTNDRTVHTHDLPQTCIDTDDEASDWDDDSVSSCTVLPAQDNGRHDDQSSVSKEHDIPEIGDNACYEKTKEKDLLNIHPIENSTLCIKSRNITNKRSANEKCLSKTRLDTKDKSRDWNDDATNSKTNILLERNADNGTHTGALQDVGTYKNDERVIVEIKNSESVKSHLKPNTLPRKCCTGDFVDKDTSKHDKSQLRHANCIKRRDNIGTDILVDDTIHNDTKTLVSADNKNSDNNESFSEGLPNKNVANVKAFGRSNDIRTFYVKKEHRHMESKGHIFIFNASIPDASTGSDKDYISNQENASNGVSNTHLDSISNEITKLKPHFSNGIMPAKVNGKILAGEGNKTSAKVLQVSRQHHIDIAPIVKSDRCTRVLNDTVSNHSFNFESGSNYSNGDEAVHRDIGLNILDKTNPGKVKQVLDIFGKGSKDKGFQRVHIINSQERYLHRKSSEDICSKQNQCQDVHEKVAITKRMQSEKIFTNKVNAYLNNSYKNDDVDIATQSKGCFTYVKHKKESTDRDMNEFNRINYDESYKPEHECCKTCYIDKKSQVADTCCKDVCKDMNHPTCLNSNGPCIINIQNLVMHINQVQDTLTTDKIACCEGRYTTSAKESTFKNGYRSNVSIPNKSVPDVPVFSTKDIPLQTVRNKEWVVGKRNKRKEAEPCVIDTDDTSTWRHMNSPSVQSVYSKCFPTQEVSQERINPFSASTVTELHTNERRTGVKRKWQKFREKYHKNNVKLIQSTCEFTSDLKPGYDTKDTKDTRDSNVQRIEKEANGVQNKVNPKVKKTVRFAEPEYNQSVLSMFFQSENNSLSTDKCQGENTTQISEQSDGLVTKLVNLIRREIDEVLDNKLDSIKFVGIENDEHLHQFDCQADVHDLYSEVKPEYLSMIDVKEERIVKTDNTRINKDSVRVVTKNGKEKKTKKNKSGFLGILRRLFNKT